MRILIVLFALLFSFGSLNAAWLENVPQTLTQPDGRVVHCFATGDEYYHWLHDANGYTIVLNPADGFFYYGKRQGEEVVATQLIAGKDDPAAAGLAPHARISERLYQQRKFNYELPFKSLKNAPTTGQVNNIAVYISFADDSLFNRTRGFFYDFYSGEDQSSLKDYYHEVSYERLFLDTYHFPESPDTIHVTYVDPNPRSYYLKQSATNPNGYPEGQQAGREHALLERALKAIENQLPDTVNFDADNDGRIDNVCFVLQGATAGWSDLLWPHRWSLYSRNVTLKGKRVWDYLLMLENSFNVGTLCHEFFHVLGAPDLYHYTDTGAPTACGGWDIMDASGNPPQYMGAFMKYKYGKWITMQEITESGIYTINKLQDPENNIYKIASPLSPSEYFVVEYRKREGRYDDRAPATGLVVYRINPSAGNGNAGGPPDEVYIYRPGGTISVNGSLSSAAFGIARKEINDKTDPASFLYNNGLSGPGGLDLFNISDPGGDTMTFEVRIVPLWPPTDLSMTMTETSVALKWEPSFAPGFKNYIVYRNGERYATTTQTSYSDQEVTEGQSYQYQVTAWYEGDANGESEPTQVMTATLLGIQALPYEEDFESADHGWIIRNSLDGFRWGNATSLEFPGINESQFLAANSVLAGKNAHTIDYAISPRLNLSGHTAVELNFDYALKRWQQFDRLRIHYRPTRNHSWTLLVDLPHSGFGMGFKWRNHSIELPAEALSDQAQIAFQYDDQNGFAYGGGIDNVIVREPASGIDDHRIEVASDLFPNPAGEQLWYKLRAGDAASVVISLINSTGQLLWKRELVLAGEAEGSIELSQYPDGLYYFMTETDQEVQLKKIIKQ